MGGSIEGAFVFDFTFVDRTIDFVNTKSIVWNLTIDFVFTKSCFEIMKIDVVCTPSSFETLSLVL